MAIDRKKMKEALISRTQKGGRKGRIGQGIFKDDIGEVNIWSCKEGDHIIDIIPYEAGRIDTITKTGDPTYCFELYVHRDVGPTQDQRVICLAETLGEACPICEHRRLLQKEGSDEANWKPLFPKQRNIYNIVCYDTDKEESKGVQIWEVAWFYMEKHLLKLAKGPMQRGSRKGGSSGIDPNIAFADPDDGRSICFNVETEGKEYHEYTAHQFEKRDYEISDEILESAHCIDEMIKIPTYAEVHELYWGEPLDGEENEIEEDIEEIEEEPKPVGRKKSNETKRRKIIEEVIEEDIPEEAIMANNNETECPVGGEFGVDTNEYENCDSCEIWESCVKSKENDVEDEDEIEEEEVQKPVRRKSKVVEEETEEVDAPLPQKIKRARR